MIGKLSARRIILMNCEIHTQEFISMDEKKEERKNIK
jgi:hypothetical protein